MLKYSYERNIGIDILRIISMLFIVILHIVGYGGIIENTEFMSSQYIVSVFIKIITCCAVNCFALISGYVGFKTSFKISRLANIWFQTVFYTISFTIIFSIFMPDIVSIKSWINAILVISTKQYWYVTAYAIMFMFIPLMNIIINKIKKEILLLLIIVALIGSSLLAFLKITNGNNFIWLGILYILGGYLSKYDIAKKVSTLRSIILFLSSSVVVLLSKLVIENSSNRFISKYIYGDIFISFPSVFIVINSVCLLLIFANINIISNKYKQMINKISIASFGVYLIHVNYYVWMYIIINCASFMAKTNVFSMILGIIVFSVIIFCICIIIDSFRIYLFNKIKIQNIFKNLDLLLYKIKNNFTRYK